MATIDQADVRVRDALDHARAAAQDLHAALTDAVARRGGAVRADFEALPLKARAIAEQVGHSLEIENIIARHALGEALTLLDATHNDIAGALNVSLEEYHKLVLDAASCRMFSFDQMSSTDDESSPADYARDERPGPLEDMQDSGFRAALAATIGQLPEREKLVLSLYYDEEMNLREIGEVLEVSESRVCQIHGQALVRVRARLAEWLSPD